MSTATKFFWTSGLALSMFLMGGTASFAAPSPAQAINLPDGVTASSVADDDDADAPDVMARVARISFLSGQAKVRHDGSDDWEAVTLNLPVIEGDEIATDTASRIEIQFAKDQYLRLDENAYLKVTTLRDDGIAASLSLGTLNLRIVSFDKDKTFFEIDAPKTTLAVQQAGSYRIDAGQAGSTEVRIAANAGGEARVYSETAGFTLKSGRAACIYLEGDRAGEWDTADVAANADEFDAWAADRDDLIANRLKTAYYGQYYDDDIYGAEDLNGYGEWIHTADYGYVWRPYAGSLTNYADWSPYRYGYWRWSPVFGWVWVNAEPWGWATYHHGRWIYVNGTWCWTPYSYYRPARSWWFPALVAINIVSDDVCWYPIGYHHRFRDYDWHHNNGNWNNNDHKKIKPRPVDPTDLSGRKPVGEDTDHIPPGGVVATDRNSFAERNKGNMRPPLEIANSALLKRPAGDTGPLLPKYDEVKKRLGRDILVDKPKSAEVAVRRDIGAEKRKQDAPLDTELRNTRILGGRLPKTDAGDTGTQAEPRKTGVIDRKPKSDNVQTPKEKATPKDSPRFEPPTDVEKRRETPKPKDPPTFDPPKPRDTSKPKDPPAQVEKPRNTPPLVTPRETPRETPKETPRETPKETPKEPPHKDPPAKDSKPDAKPPAPKDDGGKKKDGGI